MKIFAAHNIDPEIRYKSSAGGVFSVLAREMLENGGVVYGATFDKEWTVEHCRIDSIDGLSRLRGSKYVYSRFVNTIQHVVSDLQLGVKVLFSGTPCQVAAVRKRCGENANLLLVEVVCHGAPDAKHWECYLDELCISLGKTRTQIRDINFRDKRTGWKNYSFTIRFIDGSEFTQPHEKNLYMRAFSNDLTLREACFHCPFKYPDGSQTDITIGDYWGISQLSPDVDNDLGTTIIIARTAIGEAMTVHIEASALPTYEGITLYNPAIIGSSQRPANRDKFIAEVTETHSYLKAMQSYTRRPLHQSVYLFLARLKYRILSFFK